ESGPEGERLAHAPGAGDARHAGGGEMTSRFPRQAPVRIPRHASRGRAARVIAVAATALPLALILLAPLAGSLGWSAGGRGRPGGFHMICHQRRDRSFALRGLPLAVCARCFGAWAGLFAGTLATALAPPLERAGSAPRRGLLWSLIFLAVVQ